jgi:hypothetical protein
VTEPGENCLDESYENIDFEMPGSWVTEVPRKGVYTCFYCREPATIERTTNVCLELHPGPLNSSIQPPLIMISVLSPKPRAGSVPEGHVQEAFGEWVSLQKAKNVKRCCAL